MKGDNNPIKQHYVPQVYLRNFCGQNGVLYVLNKSTGKIFSTGTAGVGFEKHFYTLDKLEDPYCWEKAYARNIEPLMRDLWFKIVPKVNILVQNGCCIINENEKMQLAFIMVMQLLRGKQTRKHEEELFRELLPDIFKKAKENFGPLTLHQTEFLDSIKSDPYYLKQIAMELTMDTERIMRYTAILGWHKFIFFHLCGEKEFVTSDNPVMFLNSYTTDPRPFVNGLLKKKTIVYYPISSKVLVCVVHPDTYFQKYMHMDRCLFHLNENQDKEFIVSINRKQREQCHDQVYASKKASLDEL